MDLAAHDRGDWPGGFWNAYLDASGDHAGLPALRHQLVYRALIRALVARLRAQQTHADRAQPSGPDYLWPGPAMGGLTAASTAPQLAIITHGVSGSGKTVAAGHWSVRHEAIRLRLMWSANACSAPGAYAPEQTQRVYERLWFLADRLAAGWSVVVDATFSGPAQRQRFHMLAQFIVRHFRSCIARRPMRSLAATHSATPGIGAGCFRRPIWLYWRTSKARPSP